MTTCKLCGAPVGKRGRVYCSLECSGRAVGNRPKRVRPIAQRFEERVVRGATPDECWRWSGSTTAHGYGRINGGPRGEGIRLAHRVSWEIANGEIPNGLHVLHRCDNPPCCNPEHLFLGTAADNMHDGMAKGRIPQLSEGIDVHALRRARAAGQSLPAA